MYEIQPTPKKSKIKKKDAQNALVRALAKYQKLGLTSSHQQVIDIQGGRAFGFSRQELVMLDEIEAQLMMLEEYFYQKVTEKDMKAKEGVPDLPF